MGSGWMKGYPLVKYTFKKLFFKSDAFFGRSSALFSFAVLRIASRLALMAWISLSCAAASTSLSFRSASAYAAMTQAGSFRSQAQKSFSIGSWKSTSVIASRENPFLLKISWKIGRNPSSA